MRKFTFLTCFILLLAVTAVSPGNENEQSYLKKTENVVVEDTIKLATDIYIPSEPGQFPCILIRTPYNKDDIKGDAENFVKNGYVVVVQDSRGEICI